MMISDIANGFTETFYMTNYCWENMVHYPATNTTYNDQNIMIFDESRATDVKSLR